MGVLQLISIFIFYFYIFLSTETTTEQGESTMRIEEALTTSTESQSEKARELKTQLGDSNLTIKDITTLLHCLDDENQIKLKEKSIWARLCQGYSKRKKEPRKDTVLHHLIQDILSHYKTGKKKKTPVV